MKTLFTFLVILAAAAGGGWYWHTHKKTADAGPRFLTATITRQTIVQQIRATGTIQPIKEVTVGTQVNGRILRLYADFNSVVTNEQIVALIDPAVYEANHARDTAQLKSNLANVDQTRAKLTLAEKDLVRKTELTRRDMLSKADLDVALAERDALAAQLKVTEAAVEQSQASVKLSKTNLDYCTIRSPVNGIVIARNVDEGQTVVSSMNAQQLFLIATDLSRIQVEASIPEADIGQIRTGQNVSFNVDAHNNNTFTGEVKQVRLAAATVQNVVTYPVIVEADNPGMKLFPGMTANIEVEIARCEDTLVIPSAALRFMPTNLVTKIRGPKIWILNEDKVPEAIAVKLGISDRTQIALTTPDDLEGKEVILRFQSNGQSASGKPTNPFMPTPLGGNSRNVRRATR